MHASAHRLTVIILLVCLTSFPCCLAKKALHSKADLLRYGGRPNATYYCHWHDLCVNSSSIFFIQDHYSDVVFDVHELAQTKAGLDRYACVPRKGDQCRCSPRNQDHYGVIDATIYALSGLRIRPSSALLLSLWPGGNQFGFVLEEDCLKLPIFYKSFLHLPLNNPV